MKTVYPSLPAVAWLLAVTIATPFYSKAVISPPGLTATKSGDNLMLSFPTTTTNYYGLQSRFDFSQPWTNVKAGIPGNGATQTVPFNIAASGAQGFYRLILQPAPVGLNLPQATAFVILGHSCGGIQEQVAAAGFDAATGFPVGTVNLSTRCGGSGRGGGYQTTTYTASVTAMWDFAGHVIATNLTLNVATSDSSSIFTDAFGDMVYNSGANAYLIVPVPETPADVTAVLSGNQFELAWTPVGINPLAVTSSTLTATPSNSPAAILTSTVTGPGMNGNIPSLQPQTTYQITVANTTIGGTGPASAPITLTTGAATIPPSAPTGVTAHWVNLDPPGTTDTLIANWQAAVPGDSPIDQYQVVITGGGSLTNLVSGATLNTSFVVDFGPNWKVTVQAHNTVGWGPASTPFTLPGL